MDKFLGKWKSESSSGFEDYLKALGVGLPLRKIAAMQNPAVTIKDNDDGTYTVITATTFKTHTISFKIGEEIDEETPDGRKVKTTFAMEGEILTQVQMLGSDVSSKLVRELVDGGKLKITATAGDAVYIRTYTKE